jgi:phosphoglycolate phosphatase
MARAFQAAVFDFDYTLADSSHGIVECANYALGQLGLAAAPAERIHALIGLSLKDMFGALHGEPRGSSADQFAALFIEHADQVMGDLTVVYPWVPAAIRRLGALGILLGIVSTKFRYRIDAVLRRERLRDCFRAIVGGEDVAAFKPDPEGLIKAIEAMGVRREVAVYVGDSVTDADTARRAGVPFVAVLSGVTARESFQPYPCYGILRDVSELPDLVALPRSG